ncbi:LLM class flavin-dependent oxidoreductase, partial [Streptomyces violaceusniger]|uniref:LLM class flavin-dependent oxidoreductase n=1 Tax=Streptomyces violaceusniger TaxID=68280 RepID=UPI0001E4E4ED
MPVEFIGMISTRDQSETRLNGGPVIDKDLTGKSAPAHEDAGFDRVLTGCASSQPDGHQAAAYAAAHTERLGFLVYHGQYYQVENHYSGYSGVKSAQQPRIRLYFGGSSEAAHRVGGKPADTCALWGEPLAESAGVAA